MKLDINNKKPDRKFTNVQKFNNTLLNNQWVKEEIKREILNIMKQMKKEMQYFFFQNLWDAARAVLRGSLYDKCLHEKI